MTFLVRKNNYLNPFHAFEALQREMNQLFDQTLEKNVFTNSGLLEHSWAPATDVYEDKDNVFVKVDLPGLSKEDISVSIEQSTLTIRGERKGEKKKEEEGFIRMERFSGTFYRSIDLPADVDAGKIKAEYKNGTLELTLPKKEEARPKQISIQVK